MHGGFIMTKANRKRKCFKLYRETKDIGFILFVFGIVTICAFFLPPKAWIILLGIVLVLCGLSLLGK